MDHLSFVLDKDEDEAELVAGESVVDDGVAECAVLAARGMAWSQSGSAYVY